MAIEKPSQFRATFDDTQKALKELRHLLDELEENNSYVKNKDKFFDLIEKGLGGLDSEKQYIMTLIDGSELRINDVGGFIRSLARQNTNKIDNTFLRHFGKFKPIEIEIRYIWKEIRFVLDEIESASIYDSRHMSKEQKPKSGGKGTYVGPKNISKFTGQG